MCKKHISSHNRKGTWENGNISLGFIVPEIKFLLLRDRRKKEKKGKNKKLATFFALLLCLSAALRQRSLTFHAYEISFATLHRIEVVEHWRSDRVINLEFLLFCVPFRHIPVVASN